jgi:aminopeptidase N
MGGWGDNLGMRRPGLPGLVALAAVAGVLFVTLFPSTPSLIGPGIPEAMADDRAARVRDLVYEASFTIPATRTEPVRGALTASFTLTSADTDLAFDFAQPAGKFLSARVNGQDTTEVIARDGHLVVPAALLKAGAPNEVTFAFIAGDEALNRQDELLYTLFVPARASLTLPVFDQPNLKARWVLSLNVPAGWAAVANGAETGRVQSNGRTEIIFAKTEPLPTYLVAFAAGKFMVETAERNGRTMRLFHRETDSAKVQRNLAAVFDLHASSLSWLEDYTTIPYPFGKFDFVLIPSFQFGGMEHAGAIFYNQSSLFLDESATQNQRLGRASLIAHETAHMWFGDLVTMRWFNDVWMKEVFANFMAAKIVNPSFPDVNHPLRFLYSHYPSAYEVDRTAGANPIRQPLANLNEAGSLYGAIIYQKAPIVMRQLELLMGEEAFRDGLRDYLRTHAMANATWPDLIAVLDPRTPADLVAWSRAWVEERGRPRIHVDMSSPSAGTTHVQVRSEDPMNRGLVWPQALSVVLGGGTRATSVDASLEASGEASVTHTSGTLPAPRWVLPTGGGLGYGDFVLPADMLVRLAEDLPSIVDPLTRGTALVTSWESMLEGRVGPQTLRDALLRAVPQERDELNLSRQLGYLQSLFWRFTPAPDRAALAASLEPVLRDGLARATNTSQKSVWFSALKNTTLTPGGVEWLARVWRKDDVIAGLPFSENDEADLAMELALRGVDVLDAQEARIRNPDRKARFVFVRPAVSGDPAVRNAFFERFRNPVNRQREAWVLEAMNYIHHPLRAHESEHLVVPALQLVREIRDTGDIFFPKRWADAALGGHQSPATADAVRAFIDGLPADYPQRLRWVLEASADPLFRAARVLRF